MAQQRTEQESNLQSSSNGASDFFDFLEQIDDSDPVTAMGKLFVIGVASTGIIYFVLCYFGMIQQ